MICRIPKIRFLTHRDEIVTKASTRLVEDVQTGKPNRVDFENGIIFGVKIIGYRSTNTHNKPGAKRSRYLESCVRDALPIYEGMASYKNHDRKRSLNGEERPLEDLVGWLRDVYIQPDGMYCNFHLLMSDPDAKKILEAAEKNPSVIGLSHDAFGEGEVIGDEYIIRKITKVNSVDVVTRAATNSSLFESRGNEIARVKISAVLTQAVGKLKSLKRKSALQKLIESAGNTKLLEMEMDAVQEQEGEEEPDANGMIDAGITALLKGVHDMDMSDEDKLKKTKILMKAKEQLIGGTEDAAVEEEEEVAEGDEEDETPVGEAEEDDGDGEDEKKDSVKESKEAAKALRASRLKKRCESLCRLAGVKPERHLVESLASMGRETSIVKHLEWIKSQLGDKAEKTKARSQPQGAGDRLHESENNKPPTDRKELINWLRN